MLGDREIDSEKMDFRQVHVSQRPQVENMRILHVVQDRFTDAVFLTVAATFRGGMSNPHCPVSSGVLPGPFNNEIQLNHQVKQVETKEGKNEACQMDVREFDQQEKNDANDQHPDDHAAEECLHE